MEDEELDGYIGVVSEPGFEDLSMDGSAMGGGTGINVVLKN